MGFASVSLSSCLEVVPEDTREWKPEMAPQAMVVNRTGNTGVVDSALWNTGMLLMEGWPTMTATTARASMAYSRKEDR